MKSAEEDIVNETTDSLPKSSNKLMVFQEDDKANDSDKAPVTPESTKKVSKCVHEKCKFLLTFYINYYYIVVFPL